MSQRVALLCANWHYDLVDRARSECERTLKSGGIETEDFQVPGSLEIPLLAKKLAETGRFDAIVCFGLIVDGGIYRHEFVASSVIDGIVRAGLDTGVPVMSCVLTPIRFHEHEEHHGFFHAHLEKKGKEAGESTIATLAAHAAIG